MKHSPHRRHLVISVVKKASARLKNLQSKLPDKTENTKITLRLKMI